MIVPGISALAILAAQAAPAPVRVGAWLVGPLDAGSCQAQSRFGDHYLVSISEDSTGNGHFVLGDDRWILKDGDVKHATISWDGWETSAEATFGAVRTGSGASYLVMETGSGFTGKLAGAKRLWLRIPGIELDEQFDMPDAQDAISAIATCNEQL